MVLYAESSAVLSWLFGESQGVAAATALNAADRIVMSVLTGAECRRAVIRAATLGECSTDRAARILRSLGALEQRAEQLTMSDAVIARASAPFPVEPVRTLDAIHLASVAMLRPAYPELAVLSLDKQVRDNALAMGCAVFPDLPSE